MIHVYALGNADGGRALKDFEGKGVVITGGATGIGFGFAKAFGALGAHVVIASRRRHRVQRAVEQLRGMGVVADGTTCDVSSREDVERLADFAWRICGKVDVLMNNAGVGPAMRSIFDMPKAQVDKVFGINIHGTLHGVQVFGKRFIEQGTPCAIYNIGSEMSLFAIVPRAVEYTMSKHAVLALSESLRDQAPDFMDVGLICPGWVDSEISGSSMSMAMPTDQFVGIAMPQIRAGNFIIVSHAHNMVHIQARYDQLAEAYATYAPRYEGDAEYDARTFLGRRR